ncbi:MAG: alcohol dehydrogenase catalytic domain-containing protein [Pirellulales bacterium]|nr:alcohol dehydrogenase catalytic domain-containing protein [Pirellulales bacterium]
MKSFQLTGLREMELREVPAPELREGTDVKIRLGAVGVCGSDIHYYASGRIGSQVVVYPFAVGHECAGTVMEVGPQATRVSVGDRVAIEPAMTCGKCDQCRSQRENTCRRNRFLGCPGQAEGSLSEYLVMPEQNCFKIEDELSMAAATVSEPLAIAIYAVQQAALSGDERVGILGMGPIGRTVLLRALHLGCEQVYGTDLIVNRCAAARRAGSTWTGNPAHQDIEAEIFERAPDGLDAVFECCGQQKAIDQAIRLLRPGGKLLILGIPQSDSIRFQPEQIRRKEITIVNIRRQRGCVQQALDLIGEWPERIDQLITHRFPFSQSKDAFDLVADYRDGVVKAIIDLE